MTKKIAALALMASVSIPSIAENFYVIGNIGQNNFDDGSSHFGGGLGLGKELTNHIALELDFRTLGSTKSHTSGSGTMVTRSQFRYSSLNASAVFNLPLTSNVDLFGRLGVSSIESKLSSSSDVVFTSSKSDLKTLYGIGGALSMTEKLKLRLEYIAWQDTDFHTINLGMTYSF